MQIVSPSAITKQKIDKFPYRDKMLPVTDVWIQWLSQGGPQDGPTYGLRLFTVGPGGEIPIHKHGYLQTMYILTGVLDCLAFDAATDELADKRRVGPGEAVFVPGMEPHGAQNPSDSEPCTFLCCIGVVDEE